MCSTYAHVHVGAQDQECVCVHVICIVHACIWYKYSMYMYMCIMYVTSMKPEVGVGTVHYSDLFFAEHVHLAILHVVTVSHVRLQQHNKTIPHI